MADEGLTAAELETLLAAAQPAPKAAPRRSVGLDLQALAPAQPTPPPAPPRLNDDVKRALLALHERSGRQFAADLSALVRRAAQIKLVAVTPTTYREFIARLDSPTCFNVLSQASLSQPWLLEIGPAILFPIMDCMLGGGRAAGPIVGRPLTDIELRLAARVVGLFLSRLREAWKDVVELNLAVQRVECYPQRAAALKADAHVIWIRFELAFASARGMLNLAIPADTLTAIEPNLTGRPVVERETPEPQPASPPATVELVARLAQSKIAAVDAARLRLGDMLTTEQSVDAPIAVVQDGVVKFYARVGVVGGRKAVEIEQVVPPANDENAETG
jgi:flagellar motor switch protein FliM